MKQFLFLKHYWKKNFAYNDIIKIWQQIKCSKLSGHFIKSNDSNTALAN